MSKILIGFFAVIIIACFSLPFAAAQDKDEKDLLNKKEKEQLYPDIVKDANDKLVEGAELVGEEEFIPEDLPGGGEQDYSEEELVPEYGPQTQEDEEEENAEEDETIENEINERQVLR